MLKNEEIHDSDADVSDIDFNLSESESEEMDLSEHSSDEEFLNVSNFFYFIYLFFFRKPSLKAKKKKTTLKYDALVHHEMGFTIFISHFIFHHYS